MAAASSAETIDRVPLGYTTTLTKRTAAVEIMADESGRLQAGRITHLPAGAPVTIAGRGFSARTIQVDLEGNFYYVLASSVLH